jgi:hypothetical protein
VQIRDKGKHTNKEQRKQERMYSIRVDYSTLSISSLTRYDEDTVLLLSPPAGAAPNMEEAQTPAEGHGKEARYDQPCAPCHHGGNAGGVILSLAVGMAKGQLGHDLRQFTAYNCTSPQELRAVTKAEPPQCQDRLDQDPVSQRNLTYLLLQKATYRRQPVSTCKVLRTRVAHHCGDLDHQTFIPQLSTFREEVTILANKCKDMHKQKVYKDHWHKETPIDRGMTNVIRKELVGSMNPYGGGDTQCVGAIYQQNGLDIPDIMLGKS